MDQPASSPSSQNTDIASATRTAISTFLHEHCLSVVKQASLLKGIGMAVQAVGGLFILTGSYLAMSEKKQPPSFDGRVPGIDTAAVSLWVASLALGFLVLAFGFFLCAFARHQRAAVVTAILTSPHLSPAKALELASRPGLKA